MFLAIMALNSYSQEEAIKFSEVVNEEGKTVQELYPIIKAWIASSFKSANDVIQMDDPNNGIIICKCVFKYIYPGGIKYANMDGYVTYTLKLQVRDGRYKINIEDFLHRSGAVQFTEHWSMGLITTREKYKNKLTYKVFNDAWTDIQYTCENQFKNIVSGLKGATSGSNPVIDSDDNW